MLEESYRFTIKDTDARGAGERAGQLANTLREVRGVEAVRRGKAEPSAMDLGAIVGIVASSGAAVAIARGVADWMRRTRDVTLNIQITPGSGSIKAEVERIDPTTALRIVELLRSGGPN
jgi:hypothetical protein